MNLLKETVSWAPKLRFHFENWQGTMFFFFALDLIHLFDTDHMVVI